MWVEQLELLVNYNTHVKSKQTEKETELTNSKSQYSDID